MSLHLEDINSGSWSSHISMLCLEASLNNPLIPLTTILLIITTVILLTIILIIIVLITSRMNRILVV